jgi:hypothetical protein
MTEWLETRLSADYCPECGQLLDCASDPEGIKGPIPGDFSVCIGCGAILRFDDALKLRSASLAERSEAPPELMRIVQAIIMTRLRS